MARPRFEKLPRQRQLEILNAASEEFVARGFHDASYNAIIERAGGSKGSFYYYFEDKKDLFIAVLDHHSDRFLEGLGGVWAGEDDGRPFWVQVEALLQELMDRTAAHPEALALGKACMPIAGDPAVTALMERHSQGLARMLLVGQSTGDVRTDLPLDLLFPLLLSVGTAMDSYLLPRWDQDGTQERAMGLYMDLLRRLLSPLPPTSDTAT